MFLKKFKELMDDLGFEYYWKSFGTDSLDTDVFFVGIRNRETTSTEDGKIEGTFTAQAFSRIGHEILEKNKDLLYNTLRSGKRYVEDGNSLVISWGGSTPIDTDKQDFDCIELSFNYAEWRR